LSFDHGYGDQNTKREHQERFHTSGSSNIAILPDLSFDRKKRSGAESY
jgi:hypothetical protein